MKNIKSILFLLLLSASAYGQLTLPFTNTAGQKKFINPTTIGLGNVNNTSDANKPVSTATQTALNLKANIASPTFTGTVGGITPTMVGLGNVDNTSDANKPVSTATQTAINLKANLASPTFTGTVAGITSTMVGLGNVDNTSDANKPLSSAQQTALDLKAPLISPSFTTPTLGVASATSQAITGTAGAGFLDLTTQSVDPAAPTSGTRIFSNSNSRLTWKGSVNTWDKTFDGSIATADRTYTLPDVSGTMTVLGNTSTGSGNVVLNTSPTLVTPTLGVASATTLGIGTTSPTHSLTLNSTSTGIALYNTADQTTNFERLRIYPNANVWTILSEKGGTGTLRNMTFNGSTISFNANTAVQSNGTLTTTGLNTPAIGAQGNNQNVVFGQYTTQSQSTGSVRAYDMWQTINQTSTAGYTMLRISPYEQTTGSGSKLLIDAGTNVSGFGTHTSKFSVSNIGKVSIATGTNNTVDSGTFTGGTVTISNTSVTASSKIFIQHTNCISCGTPYIGTITAGTSFVVNSSNGSDASNFSYWIIN